VTGPTGAFVVIVYGIVQTHGVDGLIVATIMAGAILVALGLARLGGAIKFVPRPLIVGFTTGIALIIFLSQIRDLLGLETGPVPADFFEMLGVYWESARTVNPAAVALAASAILIIVAAPRVTPKIPGPFLALVATTVAAVLLDLDVETIGTRFGALASSIPAPRLPTVTFSMVADLVGPAFTIALLAAIESLLSAVVADGMIGGRHRSNMELVALGFGNIVTPLFGGIPATGAIARTATNVKYGGRTPVAAIVHAFTLLLITLFAGRWAEHIPFATLGAILVVAAYRMSEWRSFRAEFRAPRSDLFVLLTTFVLTVAVDLSVAVQVGMVLAVFLFMRRMSEVTNVREIAVGFEEETGDLFSTDPQAVARREIPPGVQVYEIDGPFFFGAAEMFKERVQIVAGKPKALILRMRHVPAIDSTGLHALRQLVERSRAEGVRVMLSGVHTQPRAALERSGLLARIGEENVFDDLDAALAAARDGLAVS